MKMSNLRLTRVALGFSLYDIRAKTAIDTGKLSLIERGYAVASKEEQRKLARALGVRVQEIFPLKEISNG